MALRRFFLQRLARDERGVSVVELAIAAPFLVMLIAGCIDLGHGLSERYVLQQAAHRTIELANTRHLYGDKDANDIDFTFLKTEAAAAAGVRPADVTLTRWAECAGEVMPQNTVCDEGVQMARYIQLEITGKYVPMLKLAHIYPRTDANGQVTMRVEAAVRIQ